MHLGNYAAVTGEVIDSRPTWDRELTKHLVSRASQTWERHKMHTQPTETEPELCLSVSCEDKGQQWPATGAGALGAADLGMV